MLRLSREFKLQLFNLLKKESDTSGGLSGKMELIPFLELIWPLRTMKSDDPRFDDAYGDAVQHLANNNDWDDNYTFLDRFKLLESDESYQVFLEAVVSPEVRHSADEIIKFILLIEPFIGRDDYTFIFEANTDNGPRYKLSPNADGSEFVAGILPNTISFYVEWNKSGRADYSSSHQSPPQFPAFALVFNNDWNDFGIQSLFNLFYYTPEREVKPIGEIKIISNSTSQSINDDLPPIFDNLDKQFCSLGQFASFYSTLKAAVGEHFESVLFALRDASLFADNHDRFENNDKFINSLIRYDNAEQALRTGKYVAYDYDLLNLYTFNYYFKPPYAEDTVDIKFEFSKTGLSSNRIYAVIGKNGTGKTQLITSLPSDIAKKEDKRFLPRAPFFSKVIAVSYSPFDRFEIPKKTSSFNYVYCGLRKPDNEPYSDQGLILRFYATWKRIQTKGRLDIWKSVLANFMDIELVNAFIVEGDPQAGEQPFKIDPPRFTETRKKLSSGQSIILFIISEITSHIRYDALLLYDEPETHLHPNAITDLIYAVYDLVEKFQSYCIIATHSPVIIRELFSRNVYVLEREDNIPLVRKINIESFGEDIGVLTNEVFGNKEVPKQYKRIIDNLASDGNSFEQIVAILESDNLPLSLNTTLYIRGAVKTTNA